MKYIGDLITEVRRDTRNEDVPTDNSQVGIADNDFLRYANFAQEKCQAVAISAKSTSFNTVVEVALVSEQVEYAIPDRVYIGEHILNVEYSHSGLARDYYEIRERPLSARNDAPGTPYYYIRRGSSILLCPAYNGGSGTVRITYERALDSLDIRRGTITAATLSATAITALTVDIADDDANALALAQYVCVNDAYGNVTMYNIPVTSYDSSTGVITIKDASFTFAAGETAAVGSYVTIGQYTTTHCKLNHLCEKYLAQYAAYKIFGRDSSNDSAGMRDDMRETLKEIITSYQEAPRDEADIFIDNKDLMVGIW